MHLSASRSPSDLPNRFPIGTTYVVEGRGGEAGNLRVFSRYVVLPGGQRINLTDDPVANPVQPSSPQRRRRQRARSGSRSQHKAPQTRAKKIAAGGGTPRQRHR